ncbi:uncharacterized protein BDCG_17118 [Blastomyces dermatitidis ER-3]|uniref:Uncharacterized protein n=3 Tax=Blastomyces TaxID=229219 RepID=A0A179V1B1_BLAGS|nr:uncharacterized protein BDBG_17920 [Blastomyces gilchristii SLH14081]XP_045281245.1 uncharacterized protein BDCG_17118 [Blastomyces dermatitidis ER-3]EGE86211.2 N-acetyltransferase [Blastomyces dermatitidis ATCC 18188]EQL29596.1 hypothetical protein BDFG_07821 [Blastomyces dermatitidis ATCC 26199]OAT01518.1 hypothetical protein BDCG_17118 [Blastomyces dermatitidis ER-3]OAT13823.1 hypothetical protein BDBG_17920 [Blastomyces gilchristii SLH14081]
MPHDSCNNHGTGGIIAESVREDSEFDIVLPAPPESTPSIINSQRLILREVRDSDAEGLFAIRSREDAVRTLRCDLASCLLFYLFCSAFFLLKCFRSPSSGKRQSSACLIYG